MTLNSKKVNIRTVCIAATEFYAAFLLTVFFLAVPMRGYRVIADLKYHLYLAVSLAYLTVMAGLGIAAYARGKRTDFKWMKDPVYIAAVSYLALTAVSALLSPYGKETLLGGTRHDGLLTAALYTATFLLMSRYLKPRRYFLWLLAGSTAVCCALTIVQLAGYNPLGLYPAGMNYYGAGTDYTGSFAGTFGNVDMGMAVLAGSAAAITAGLVRIKYKREWLMLLPLAMDIYVLVRVNVLASLLAVTAGAFIAVPGMLSGKNRRTGILILSAAAVAAIALLWFGNFGDGMFYEASELLHGRARPEFGSGRIYIWRHAVEAFREHPFFGTGPDTFRFLDLDFRQVRDGVEEIHAITAAHNEYLNILVNQGIFALAAFCAMPVTLCLRWYKGRISAADSAGAFAAAYAVAMFFGISMPLNAPFFWAALAMMNNVEKVDNLSI